MSGASDAAAASAATEASSSMQAIDNLKSNTYFGQLDKLPRKSLKYFVRRCHDIRQVLLMADPSLETVKLMIDELMKFRLECKEKVPIAKKSTDLADMLYFNTMFLFHDIYAEAASHKFNTEYKAMYLAGLQSKALVGKDADGYNEVLSIWDVDNAARSLLKMPLAVPLTGQIEDESRSKIDAILQLMETDPMDEVETTRTVDPAASASVKKIVIPKFNSQLRAAQDLKSPANISQSKSDKISQVPSLETKSESKSDNYNKLLNSIKKAVTQGAKAEEPIMPALERIDEDKSSVHEGDDDSPNKDAPVAVSFEPFLNIDTPPIPESVARVLPTATFEGDKFGFYSSEADNKAFYISATKHTATLLSELHSVHSDTPLSKDIVLYIARNMGSAEYKILKLLGFRLLQDDSSNIAWFQDYDEVVFFSPEYFIQPMSYYVIDASCSRATHLPARMAKSTLKSFNLVRSERKLIEYSINHRGWWYTMIPDVPVNTHKLIDERVVQVHSDHCLWADKKSKSNIPTYFITRVYEYDGTTPIMVSHSLWWLKNWALVHCYIVPPVDVQFMIDLYFKKLYDSSGRPFSDFSIEGGIMGPYVNQHMKGVLILLLESYSFKRSKFEVLDYARKSLKFMFEDREPGTFQDSVPTLIRAEGEVRSYVLSKLWQCTVSPFSEED